MEEAARILTEAIDRLIEARIEDKVTYPETGAYFEVMHAREDVQKALMPFLRSI